MKHIFRHLSLVAALAVIALASFGGGSAFAATATPKHARNLYFQGVADATSTTFATTAYADLTGASVTVFPVVDPNQTDAASPLHTDYLKVSVTLNLSKATATSGQCGVFVNGAVLAKTAQVQNFLANVNQNVTGVWLIPNSTTGSQTVKVQCKSADTNVLTVSAGHIFVEELD